VRLSSRSPRAASGAHVRPVPMIVPSLVASVFAGRLMSTSETEVET
jgi:hypothetical protein